MRRARSKRVTGSSVCTTASAVCRPTPGWVRSRTTRGSAAARVASSWLTDRKSTRLNSSHGSISYAVFCLKKKKKQLALDIRKRCGFEADLDDNDCDTLRQDQCSDTIM